MRAEYIIDTTYTVDRTHRDEVFMWHHCVHSSNKYNSSRSSPTNLSVITAE